MSKFTRKTIILAKAETTPGTDAVPVGTTNAILVRNPSITPLETTMVERNLVRGFFGNQDALLSKKMVKCSFEVELAGSGAAGTAPSYGLLLQACGMTETLVVSTSAAYAPNSTNAKTVTLYYFIDGVLHKLLWGIGNATFNLKANEIPYITFEFIGLDGGQTDTANATPTYTGFQRPLVANKLNTPTFQLHGVSTLALEMLSITLGNQLEQVTRIGSEQMLQTDRNCTGSVMFEAVSIATKDWYAAIRNATLSTLQLIHGSVAGNILQFDSSNVQLSNPQISDQQGVEMLQLALQLNPSNAGNDELTFTAK